MVELDERLQGLDPHAKFRAPGPRASARRNRGNCSTLNGRPSAAVLRFYNVALAGRFRDARADAQPFPTSTAFPWETTRRQEF
jgi:hypothetical protein